MSPKIYRSSNAPLPVASTSVFTHLFASPEHDLSVVGGYPGAAKAFIDSETGATLTRAQTKQLALTFAYGLRQHPATAAKRGDVVLIFSHNSLSWPVVLFGSIAAGLRCTLANSAFTPKELAFQYRDSGANLIFTSEQGIATVFAAFGELGICSEEARKRIIVLEAGLEWAGGPAQPPKPEAAGLLRMQDLLGLGALSEEEKFDGNDCHETAYMCYSSGTTGKPKGVETTHQNINIVMDIVKSAFEFARHGIDTMLGVLPFFHVYGAIKLLHFPFYSGAPVVIQSGFNPDKFCESIQKYNVTISLIVPPILVVLSRHPAVDTYDVSSLQCLFSGAAPLGPSLVKQVTDRFKAKKKGKGVFVVLQGYGLTETSPTATMLPAKDGTRKIGSIGLLLQNLEARLVLNGETDAQPGEPGELWLRGPSIMKGYLNNLTATKDSITVDGWFMTGDVAVRDSEGYYYIVDRQKELIKYKGFQVPPAELESVLLSHPAIADAAVIGINSAKQATELPRAYVVHADSAKIRTAADKKAFERSVQKWIQGKVARHKFLRGGVMTIDTIPKSASGKILRRELREKAKMELGGRDPYDVQQAKL